MLSISVINVSHISKHLTSDNAIQCMIKIGTDFFLSFFSAVLCYLYVSAYKHRIVTVVSDIAIVVSHLTQTNKPTNELNIFISRVKVNNLKMRTQIN